MTIHVEARLERHSCSAVVTSWNPPDPDNEVCAELGSYAQLQLIGRINIPAMPLCVYPMFRRQMAGWVAINTINLVNSSIAKRFGIQGLDCKTLPGTYPLCPGKPDEALGQLLRSCVTHDLAKSQLPHRRTLGPPGHAKQDFDSGICGGRWDS